MRRAAAGRVADAIRADLLQLLDTRAGPPIDPARWPAAAGSVLNYGVPDLTGLTTSGLDAAALTARLVKIVRQFEPRLIAQTLAIECKAAAVGGSVDVTIAGEFWIGGQAEPFDLSLTMDLHGGPCRQAG